MNSLALRRLAFAFFPLLFVLPAFAQQAPFLFTNYNVTTGLASNEVSKVQQDREGYIWLATANGLQRFDGTRFKTFRHIEGDSTSLPASQIYRMLIDKKDRLWLGTHKSKFVLFDKHRFTARIVPVEIKKPSTLRDVESRFIEDEEGRLFLSVRGGEIFLYDERKGAFVSATGFLHIPESWGITTLSQEPKTKKYWMGIGTGGLAVFNPKTGNLSYYGHNVENEPAVAACGPKMGFAYSLFDKKGRFWWESWLGTSFCVQYDPQRKEAPLKKFELITELKTYYEIHNISEQRNTGRIWVSGAAVLAYYDDTADKFTVVPSTPGRVQGAVYEETSAVFEDREENLWFGTRKDGVYRFNPAMQYFANVLHSNRAGGEGKGTPMSFVQLHNGDFLNGIWEDGVLRYNARLQEVPLGITPAPGQSLRNSYIWSACRSADGNTVWLGAQPGLGQFDEKAATIHFRNPPALGNRTVRQVVEDAQGSLWLGMHAGGVYRWFNPKRTGADSVVKVEPTGTDMVNKLMADRRGWIWVATGNNGLFIYEAASGRLLQHVNGDKTNDGSVPGTGVTGLLDYNDSLVLVADEFALFVFNRNNGRFSRHRLSANLTGGIAAMEKDNDGYVWIGTTTKLHRMHPAQRAVVIYDRRDGILNDQFALSASYKLADGRLLFGNSNGFICFNPRVAGATPPPSPVSITGLQIGRQEVNADSVMRLGRLELTVKNNSLTVDFSSLQYAFPFPVQYKIENIDKDWQIADGSNRIAYPLLPPGRYTLRLRSFDTENRYSAVTELKIRVRPPWYQTWWFYTLVAIAFVAELWWLDRQRSKRKAGMQKVRTDIAANLHEEINTALANINILSEIARLKSDREPQKAKEYLEQIHTKSHNMIIVLDDMLWSLNPDNDSMKKTVTRIREFADALMQRHGTLIELLIDKKVEGLELNMKLRHEAFLLFKEGLRSLVEAGTPHCIVHLTAERTKLLFTIEFANEGCDMQQLNNLLQRRDMALRIQALKAKLDVQLHKSRSVFLLQLPLGQG